RRLRRARRRPRRRDPGGEEPPRRNRLDPGELRRPADALGRRAGGVPAVCAGGGGVTYELAARHLPLLRAGRQLPRERGAAGEALAVQRLAQDSGRLGSAGDVGHGSRGQGGVREAQEREGSSMNDPFNDTHEMQTRGPIERDPNGIDPHEPGAKLDAGKVEPELIQRGFARALLAVADVGTYGATKYTRDGWQDVQ